MTLKHVAVTQEQYNDTWNALPQEMRFQAVDEDRYKAGFICFELDGLLLWSDYLLPEGQVSDEVKAALARIVG